MRKKGFIFDLDGVIVDTAKYHFLAWKDLAEQLHIHFTKKQNEQLKGISRIKSLEKILSLGNKTITKEKFQELMAQKNDDYLNYVNQMDASEILPDVPKVLNYLIKKQQPIALGSASKNARFILKKVDLLHKFPTIIDGNEVANGKPNPEVFLKAAKKLQMKPENCIVFEDAVAGIKAANTAQMISVGIGERDILHEANFVFKDFTEISTTFLNELIKK